MDVWYDKLLDTLFLVGRRDYDMHDALISSDEFFYVGVL